MTDVVVDQKRMPLAPVDPDARIPDSVKRRAAAVDEFYKQQQAAPPPAPESAEPPQPSPAVEAPSPQAAPPVPQEVVEPTPPAAPPEPEPAVETPTDTRVDWRRQYHAMKGRFDEARQTIGQMEEQMAQMGDELLRSQQAQPRPSQPSPSQTPSYLTEQDVQNYGSDLINFAQRAAAQALVPELRNLEQQNVELQRRLAYEARQRMDQAVENAVPNYREIDTNPRWHQWLRLPDTYSGRIRQQLLNEAITAGNASRVISFFHGFLNEERATGNLEPGPASPPPRAPREPAVPMASLAAPGRARPASGGEASVPPDKPFYTRAQIRDNYRLHQRGAYVGREAEWNRLERDMIQAPLEGRVR